MNELCFMTNVSADSWAQLWGAGIGAFVGAIVALTVVYLQHRLEQRRAQQAAKARRLDQYNALISVAKQACTMIDAIVADLRRHVSSGTPLSFNNKDDYVQALSIEADMLNEFRLVDLPAYVVMGEVGTLRRVVREFPDAAWQTHSEVLGAQFFGKNNLNVENYTAKVQSMKVIAQTVMERWVASRGAEANAAAK